MTKNDPKCVDCIALRGSCFRKCPYPGPRCREHHLAGRRDKKIRRHRSTVEKKYNLPPGGYDAIYVAQGGKCYICRRATGKSKNLSVDHSHAHCDYQGSCGDCVRCLACTKCNRGVLGHLRDDPEALRRAIEVVTRLPAQDVLRVLRSAGSDFESIDRCETIDP